MMMNGPLTTHHQLSPPWAFTYETIYCHNTDRLHRIGRLKSVN